MGSQRTESGQYLQHSERSYTDILEKPKHFIVRSVVRDEEAQICVAQYRSNTDQPSSASGNNTDILPRVLAVLAFSIVVIVEVCDCSS